VYHNAWSRLLFLMHFHVLPCCHICPVTRFRPME
jgi:hypothetical protein